jgi:hypothetical protein
MLQYVERFEAAVHALISEGPVKSRLIRAYTEYLEDLQDVELPINSKGALAELHSALHRVRPVGKQSLVNASVQKMSPGEAGCHAETILKLYGELVLQASRLEPLKVVERSESRPAAGEPGPPRFLVNGS